MQKILFIFFISIVLSACGNKITTKEKVLIQSGDSETPFEVLQISNKTDSLFLRQKCKDIIPIKDDETLSLLLARMKATLIVEDGVGIAAPQIGISRNIFLFTRIDKPDMPVEVAINPKIINHSEELTCFEDDGCLSIPDVWGNSIRYTWIDVEYLNENGEKIQERLTGHSRKDNFVSVIFQHEYDHLQGILFIDKLCE